MSKMPEAAPDRIGQDLHDGICQSLAAIQFAVTSIRDDLKEQRPTESAALHDIATMVKDTIAETRNLARGGYC